LFMRWQLRSGEPLHFFDTGKKVLPKLHHLRASVVRARLLASLKTLMKWKR